MKISNFPPSLEQIQNTQYSDQPDPDLETGKFIIIRYDDDPNQFDVYHESQKELSDPDPLFTGNAIETYQFFQNQ